jgi:hemolysin III
MGAARDAATEAFDSAARGAAGAARGAADAARGAADAADTARAAAGQRLADAREAAGDRLSSARDSTGQKLVSAAEVAVTALGRKPALRGVSHQWAFVISMFAGLGLLLIAEPGEPRLAAAIYAVSLSALFGVSALYHRVTWRSESARLWMRRLDHTMIFVLIAGTYTPFALLAMDGELARVVLIALWAAAAAGVVLNLLWIDAPKALTSTVFVSVGLLAALPLPELASAVGPVAIGLIALGGALYVAGAAVYALRRPDPRPAVFGYHEVFHLLVIAAAIVQFVAVAVYALPAG